jgi:two-component system, LytTR family, response regulator
MNQLYNLKILIIEDEPSSAIMLRQFLYDLMYEDIHIFSDAKSGMEAIKLIKPDIIFLDIYLKEENGIDVLKFVEATKMHTHVIVTTENDKCISEVIRYSVIDFLLKPCSRDDIRRAIEKVEQHILLHNHVKSSNNNFKGHQLIEINSNKEICFYNPQNVVYIEADGNYSQIFMIDGRKDTVTQNLGKLADKFPDENFVRVSRKSIVNINFMRKLNKLTGELELEYNGNILKINTSKKYFLQGH